MTIFIGFSIFKNDPDFSSPFYHQKFFNACCEMIFIVVEYFIIRIPLFNIFNDWYIFAQNIPGIVHGLSWYLYIVVCIGQCNLMINRFIVLKRPTDINQENNKLTIYLIMFQVLLPSFMIFIPMNCHMKSYYTNNNKTLIFEVDNKTISNTLLTSGVIIGIIMCLFGTIIGTWNIFLLKKIVNHKNSYNKRIKKELPLFLYTFLQTIAFIILTITEIIQFISGSLNYDNWYALAIHIYPLSEDLLCLSDPFILYSTNKIVRKKFTKFWSNKLCLLNLFFFKKKVFVISHIS
ncbi:7TM GPCR, serpentine receptor class v (Srv) family-containing protein [Strongyloides ratti]|uniref:7TM GPCR, serpentine receptor class v (Srv) family-containing protein n=1 Tax=Strongyloides ratti TaxID=34506 RepID=A0A090LPE7_STRRB|nr:7TM GPCR, serpentine receptor class v (Srv) family-containing protein [Strongyloides ratti]CEF70069.1 7TM GPCR, serpentine receptor class v (Srv) family-containing protein [Strongyloides ratti]